ncbi:MD-2-related lipid recognition domain-containing protein / ML domain-containing protein [Thalictrum thalictroides]|uniref:MD-2-related lipid recognition domain-containing protein / ML domain-containing protein n=1 Tax=Thalictrum thalictroides TaxID=46969 RepID=A0A7J6W061_THATH|nr:MD-2-related lipid recognition domain-containing protein / ML domain-containing protein [Thalictrum thalictroides]
MAAIVQLKLTLSLIFVAFLFLHSVQAKSKTTKVEYCDNKTKYAVNVTGVEITPNPVSRGKPTTFVISASTGESISGGDLTIEVKYFGLPVHSEKFDLCKETSCPVATGDFVVSHTQELPGVTPPGTYTLKLKMLQGDGKELSCVHFDFSIGWWIADEAGVVADS